MVNVIIQYLTNKFSKEFSILFVGANLGLDIEINSLKEQATWFFSSNVLISNTGEISPEFPCGKIDYKLIIDVKNRTYRFDEFNFSYNLNNCDTYNDPKDIISNSNSSNETTSQNKFLRVNKETLLYGIPAAIATAGIASTPFILGILGGKRNRKSKRMRKKQRRKISYKVR